MDEKIAIRVSELHGEGVAVVADKVCCISKIVIEQRKT